MERSVLDIFKKIAAQNSDSVENVIKDMEKAIDEALANPESRRMMEAVPHLGEKPTPEEVILYVVSKVEA